MAGFVTGLLAPVVLDCGTSLIKAGLAGGQEPTVIEPTCIGYSTNTPDTSADVDYFIGDEALMHSPAYAVSYPMKRGVINDFEAMERIWIDTIFKKLKVVPQDHYFILTEPPLNSPENRETTAEIMFETVGVPGLHIGVQAVLALYAAGARSGHITPGTALTGVVVDSGDGCTHVCPVSEGYVMGSSMKSIPIAGRNVTDVVLRAMRERKEAIPRDASLEIAKKVKERYCYICGDVVKECDKYESDPGKYYRQYNGVHPRTGKGIVCNAREERFLGPEIFFNPISYGLAYEHTPSLPQLIDDAIQSCPIDTRRSLYGNITLSGGSTMFKNFDQRLQRDTKRLVDIRAASWGGTNVTVNVVSHPMQRYAVWYGGSHLGMTHGFNKLVFTKEQYEEQGPRIVRNNPVYNEF